MVRFVVKCIRKVEKSLNKSYLISAINKSAFLPEYSEDELLCDVMTHQKQLHGSYKIPTEV
jgi:hypothetical protein